MKRDLIIITAGLLGAALLGFVLFQSDEVSVGADNVLPIAGQTYVLAGAGISSSATSFSLTSLTIPQNGYVIQDSDVSETFYVTIEPGSRSRQEIVSCTTVTQNADGTATLSGCTRGLSPVTPYTASSSLQFAHAGGSSVIFSDPPQLFNQTTFKDNDETITGTWLVPTPLSDSQIATKKYVDDNVSGGTVSNDRLVVAGNAGETVATSTVVYFDGSDQEWKKVDVDTASTYQDKFIGLTQGAGTDGAAITDGILLKGRDNLVTGLTAGSIYYASTSAGTITTDSSVQPIGVAEDTNVLYFDPVLVGVAFTGQDNTFSGVNRFTGEAVEVGLIEVNAGETINGATLPVPVYMNSSDSEVYAMDGNATTTLEFFGFAVSNSTDGNAILVQQEGIVSGFSSLEPAVEYFVQDTAGTLASTTGTYDSQVGIAVSATELLIRKGVRRFVGQVSDLGTATNAITVNTGFTPSTIRFYVSTQDTSTAGSSAFYQGIWANGTLTGVSTVYVSGGTSLVTSSNRIYEGNSDGSAYMTLSVSTTDTSFTMTFTETGTFDASAELLMYEVIGDY